MATFTSTSSDDTFNGSSASDRVVFAGNAAGYRIDLVNGFVQIVDIDATNGDTGTDRLTGIETLDFADKDFSLAGASNRSMFGETRGNTYTNSTQGYAAITGLDGGGYVVTWSSADQDGDSYGIYAQRYDANGLALGSETRVNTYVTSAQIYSAITGLDNGGYVVAWTSYDQDGSAYGIYAQRYNAGGTKVGAETRVNTFTASEQMEPEITALANGGYVVTWTSGQDGDGWGINMQRYDANGNQVGAETPVNTYVASDQIESDVAALTGGGYVITWSSNGPDGDGYGIYAQRYDADGLAAGIETRVNTFNTSAQIYSAITSLTSGGYVITWASYGQDGDSYGIYAQRYNAGGATVGLETRINTHTTSDQIEPDIAALTGGGYVITWSSNAQDGDSYGIYAQRYNDNGSKVGAETRVNTDTSSAQMRSAITSLADGGYVITWESFDQDGSNYGIYSQRYDASGQALANSLEITGTTGNDVINAGAGEQILIGGAGADVLKGGIGNDTYVLTDNDTVTEFAGQGTDTVQASFSYTLGANVENLTLTGSSAINGTGNTLNNILTGNAADNILNGGTGTDQLRGGLGNDTYVLTDSDAITENASAGTDTVQANFSYTLGANLERLILTGTAAINGTGNSLGNIITGNGGVNNLNGSAGNDTLNGGNGNDVLVGGSGNDALSGGSGADKFRFNGTLSASTNVDTVKDFSVGGGDVIQLENAIFNKLTAIGALNAANFRANTTGTAVDSNDYIVYETDTGKLFYDADGNGAGAKVQFALIGTTTHAALTAADFAII